MTAHACNNPLTCRVCVRRFWKWVENHTRGRVITRNGECPQAFPSFYEAAAKFINVDNRSRR